MTDNFFLPEERRPLELLSGDVKNGFAQMVETWWRALRRHMLAAALLAAAALVAALVATMLMTPQYTAFSRVEITREETNITNVEGLEAEGSNQDLEFYQTQYSLLEARSVAQRVAEALNVAGDNRLFAAHDVDIDLAWSERAGGDMPEARFRIEQATDLLLQNVAVAPVRGSRLVDVQYTSPDAEFSAEVANLWVDQFQALSIDRRFLSTADAREYLETRLAELREKLETSQRELVGYAAANEIIMLTSDQDSDGNTDTAQTLRSSNLQALNDALSAATAQRVGAEARAQQVSAASAESLGNQALNTMRERRAEVSAQLASLEAVFEPEYPEVLAARSQREELDRSIAREETRIRAAATGGFQAARSQEADLQRRVNTLKGAMLEERRSSIQYSIFQRDVDTNRELYEALLQRYKEIGVAGVQTSNVAVVDRAKLPEVPSSPNLPLNLMLGLIGGMALAGGYVFAREQLDQSLRDPSMVSEVLGLPLLGAVPKKTFEELAAEIGDPKSDVSEAYLAAASNLSFLTTTGAPGSILITSSRAGEGKSTTARALATSLTRIGKRVLLIDADMRKPSQHSFFGIDNTQGLSHLLSGHIAPDAVRGLIRGTGEERLALLTAGPPPPDPGVLLNNGRLPIYVGQLKADFDHVIIDAPPVLGLADAPLLASVADGVIYVIESNGVHMRVIRASLRRLQFSGARLFGGIVTKVVVNSSSYGYGEMYGYGYGADRGR